MDKAKMLEMLKRKKKEGADLSDNEKNAKLGVIDDIRSMASEMMGQGMKGLKKVTVASPTKEGLAAGLEKAETMVEDAPEGEEEYEEDMGKMEEPSMTEEEIDAKINHLMDMKRKLSSKEGSEEDSETE